MEQCPVIVVVPWSVRACMTPGRGHVPGLQVPDSGTPRHLHQPGIVGGESLFLPWNRTYVQVVPYECAVFFSKISPFIPMGGWSFSPWHQVSGIIKVSSGVAARRVAFLRASFPGWAKWVLVIRSRPQVPCLYNEEVVTWSWRSSQFAELWWS